jgi:hypothetical protein
MGRPVFFTFVSIHVLKSCLVSAFNGPRRQGLARLAGMDVAGKLVLRACVQQPCARYVFPPAKAVEAAT